MSPNMYAARHLVHEENKKKNQKNNSMSNTNSMSNANANTSSNSGSGAIDLFISASDPSALNSDNNASNRNYFGPLTQDSDDETEDPTNQPDHNPSNNAAFNNKNCSSNVHGTTNVNNATTEKLDPTANENAKPNTKNTPLEPQDEDVNEPSDKKRRGSSANPFKPINMTNSDTIWINPSTNNNPSTHIKIWAHVTHEANSESKAPITAPTLHDIFTTTIAHHAEREPTITFETARIEYCTTTRSPRNKNNFVSKFQVTIQPAPTNDAFDSHLYHDQVFRFAAQNWQHRSNNDFTPVASPDAFPKSIPDRAMIVNPPSVNPWAPHTQLYLPACNSFTEKAYGILLGLSPRLGTSRRFMMYLAAELFTAVRPQLPAYLQDPDTFFDNIGLRFSLFHLRGAQTGQKAYYISTSTDTVWYQLLRAIDKLTSFQLLGIACAAVPFPTSSTDKIEIFKGLHTIDNNFATLKPILHHRLINLSPTHLTTLRNMDEFRTVVPNFDIADFEPTSYTFYCHVNPTTADLNERRIELLPGFPQDIIVPSMAQVVAQANTTSTTYRPSHTQRLHNILSSWNKQNHCKPTKNQQFLDSLPSAQDIQRRKNKRNNNSVNQDPNEFCNPNNNEPGTILKEGASSFLVGAGGSKIPIARDGTIDPAHPDLPPRTCNFAGNAQLSLYNEPWMYRPVRFKPSSTPGLHPCAGTIINGTNGMPCFLIGTQGTKIPISPSGTVPWWHKELPLHTTSYIFGYERHDMDEAWMFRKDRVLTHPDNKTNVTVTEYFIHGLDNSKIFIFSDGTIDTNHPKLPPRTCNNIEGLTEDWMYNEPWMYQQPDDDNSERTSTTSDENHGSTSSNHIQNATNDTDVHMQDVNSTALSQDSIPPRVPEGAQPRDQHYSQGTDTEMQQLIHHCLLSCPGQLPKLRKILKNISSFDDTDVADIRAKIDHWATQQHTNKP